MIERIPVLENDTKEIALVFPSGKTPKDSEKDLGCLRLFMEKESGALFHENGSQSAFGVATDAIDVFTRPRRCLMIEIREENDPHFTGWVVVTPADV